MASQPLHGRNRTLGNVGTIAVHLLVVAVLVLFSPHFWRR